MSESETRCFSPLYFEILGMSKKTVERMEKSRANLAYLEKLLEKNELSSDGVDSARKSVVQINSILLQLQEKLAVCALYHNNHFIDESEINSEHLKTIRAHIENIHVLIPTIVTPQKDTDNECSGGSGSPMSSHRQRFIESGSVGAVESYFARDFEMSRRICFHREADMFMSDSDMFMMHMEEMRMREMREMIDKMQKIEREEKKDAKKDTKKDVKKDNAPPRVVIGTRETSYDYDEVFTPVPSSPFGTESLERRYMGHREIRQGRNADSDHSTHENTMRESRRKFTSETVSVESDDDDRELSFKVFSREDNKLINKRMPLSIKKKYYTVYEVFYQQTKTFIPVYIRHEDIDYLKSRPDIQARLFDR